MTERIANKRGPQFGQRINSGRVGNSMTKQEREYLYEQIERCYASGMSDLRIAEYVGVCDKTVARWRRRNSLPNLYGRYNFVQSEV